MRCDLTSIENNGLSQAKRFGLAVGGVLAKQNRLRLDMLHTEKVDSETKTDIAHLLARDWSIQTTEDLKEQLASLLTGSGFINDFNGMIRVLTPMDEISRKRFVASHRQDAERYAQWVIVERSLFRLNKAGITAWDHGRLVMLSRWGATIDLISDQYAWDMILQSARTVQSTFSDWYEYGISYVTGRCFWMGTLAADQSEYLMQLVKELLYGENAPWALNWQTDLS